MQIKELDELFIRFKKTIINNSVPHLQKTR